DPGMYISNYPGIYLLKPGEKRTITFDLSRDWSLPNNLPYAMPEGMSIRCVLHQRLEVDGHLGGLFTGRVTSPWFGGKHDAEVGACVEWHPLPAKSKGETFDLPGLFKRLDTLQEPKSPSPLLDWFGADADWNQVVIIHERPGAMLYPKLMLLFDNASALLLNYPAANRALDSVPFSNESSLKSSEDSERPQPNWALASDRLPRLSASGIDQITFLSGSNETTPRTFISWARQANGSYLRLNDETRTKPAK
ncbi:MAG: hypothetical protein JWO89_721, partial [Verrucomicrobiaceae bacterium]|nr:hypothetical protein [Verrucomicrobiaceae bacterium]